MLYACISCTFLQAAFSGIIKDDELMPIRTTAITACLVHCSPASTYCITLQSISEKFSQRRLNDLHQPISTIILALAP